MTKMETDTSSFCNHAEMTGKIRLLCPSIRLSVGGHLLGEEKHLCGPDEFIPLQAHTPKTSAVINQRPVKVARLSSDYILPMAPAWPAT